MKSFSELAIAPLETKNMFVVPIVSIEDVVNFEIEVLDFVPGVETKYGKERCVLKIRYEGKECKFFTNASPIKDALSKVPKEEFPFSAVIKQQRFGNKKTFYFT